MTHQELRDIVHKAVGPGAFKGGAEVGYLEDGRPSIHVRELGREYVAHHTNEHVVMVIRDIGGRRRSGYLNPDGTITDRHGDFGPESPGLN